MKYIRKINGINNWNPSKTMLYDGSFSSGDILFKELRTTKNTLSIWSFTNDHELKDVLVAIALNRDNIQKLNYMILDDDEISQLGIFVEPEQGIADGLTDNAILNRHHNLTKIDFWRLGYVSEYFIELAKDENRHNSITEKRLFGLIRQSVDSGKINYDQMKPAMRSSYDSHKEKQSLANP